MAQAINFAINIDQSQLPSVYQQLQSNIAAQLQSSALQIGNMNANLSQMMATAPVGGMNPATYAMPYAMAPYGVVHNAAVQPFIDRNELLVNGMRDMYSAVVDRAKSLIVGTSGLLPKTASTGQLIGKGVTDTLAEIGMMMASGGIAEMSMMGIRGLPGLALSFGSWSGVYKLMDQIAGQRFKKFADRVFWGIDKNTFTPGTPEYQMELTKNIQARDTMSALMTLAPQKLIQTRFGEVITPDKVVTWGRSIRDELELNAVREKNFAWSRFAAVGQVGLKGYMNAALMSPEFNRAITNVVSENVKGREPDKNLIREFINELRNSAIRAPQALGFSGSFDSGFERMVTALLTAEKIPAGRGISQWDMIGMSIGAKYGITQAMGLGIINQIKTDARRDLGLTEEERKALGGKYGIGTMYGSFIAQNVAQFGGMHSIYYAALMNSGAIPEYAEQIGPAAAPTFSNVKDYWRYRLNWKEVYTAGKGKAAVAAHKSFVGKAAEHLMRVTPPGTFRNRYEARRAVYEMLYQMSPEQAAAMAGMDESVGIYYEAKGTGKLTLSEIFGSQATGILKTNKAAFEAIGITSEADLETIAKNARAFNRKDFITETELPESVYLYLKEIIDNNGITSISDLKKYVKGKPQLEKAVNRLIDAQVTVGMFANKTAFSFRQTQNAAALQRSITISRSQFTTPKEIPRELNRLSDDMLRLFIRFRNDELSDTEKSRARATLLAEFEKQKIPIEYMDFAIAKGSDIATTMRDIRSLRDKKGNIISSSSGEAGMYDEIANTKEEVRILKELISVLQKRLDSSTVRNKWQ